MAQMQFRSDDTEVWPYKFGDGSDGAYNSSSSVTWNPTDVGCAGTAGNYSITADAGSMSNGQLVLIHQSRGTNAGVWELNKIASGGGTTSLTMAHALKNSYVNSGSSQAQMVRIYEYTDFTLNSGHTITSKAWNGSDGGIIAIAANGTATINGQISASSKGFTGGRTGYLDIAPGPHSGATGEGTAGASVPGGQCPECEDAKSPTNNSSGNAGGGGSGARASDRSSGGGGGGNGTAGSSGLTAPESPICYGGNGGSTSGSSQLTTMTFGGGGGGGGKGKDGTSAKYGGAGGGIVLIIAKNIVVGGTIYSNGEAGDIGGDGDRGGAGGGAGGSILLKGVNVNIGTNKVRTQAGPKGASADGNVLDMEGGDGGKGRIAINYLVAATGSTSSSYYGSYNASQDYSLRLGYSSSVII